MPLTLTPLTPLSLSPRRGRGADAEGVGGWGHYPLRRRRRRKGSHACFQSRGASSARLNEFGLAPYFASEPRLKGGGLSEYPFALRSPSEAKYGAKKGKFERGSDPLHRGSERGAKGKEGRGALLLSVACATRLLLASALSPCPPLHIRFSSRRRRKQAQG